LCGKISRSDGKPSGNPTSVLGAIFWPGHTAATLFKRPGAASCRVPQVSLLLRDLGEDHIHGVSAEMTKKKGNTHDGRSRSQVSQNQRDLGHPA